MILTNDNITGISTNTPTTTARVTPECTPKRIMATVNSKKLLAPMNADGAALQENLITRENNIQLQFQQQYRLLPILRDIC